jgi:hypothetical protein
VTKVSTEIALFLLFVEVWYLKLARLPGAQRSLFVGVSELNWALVRHTMVTKVPAQRWTLLPADSPILKSLYKMMSLEVLRRVETTFIKATIGV